jgi:hypothetical protein
MAFSTLLSNHCCSWLQCYVIFVLASPVTVTAALVGFCLCMAELYCCCIVVPAGTALLFCCNPFIVVYLHMLIAALVFMLHGQGQSSKISAFTRLPRKQSGWWYMVKHSRRPAIAGPVS